MLLFVASAGCAAVAVATGSWWLGHRAAMSEMRRRFDAIETAMQHSTYPLSSPILKSLSDLTGAQWMTVDAGGRIASTTITTKAVNPALFVHIPVTETPSEFNLDSVDYFAFRFSRQHSAGSSAAGETIVVLFEKSKIRASASRAAIPPLLTGLSTIAIVSGLLYWIASRLIGRLRRLESQVGKIAGGDFESRLIDEGNDEVGRLANAISVMADQLRSLWDNVNQQQRAKLLHQVSSGMAHQLRNTLTGARMAMELHQGEFDDAGPEEVQVAIRQLELAEDYVQRLLALGTNPETPPRPAAIRSCLEDVRSTHQTIASHLGVGLEWSLDHGIVDQQVRDGPTFSAAVSNLLLNAMDAGDRVTIGVSLEDPGRCVVMVSDNGDGIDENIQKKLFDPFVTSKPEGMGLGLSLVRQSAEDLGGSIRWHRTDGRTVFELTASCDEGARECQD